MNVPLWKNMQLIDTNVILRFILNDHDEMSKLATEVIESGAYTKPEVIAEVVYVLKSVYATPKEKIKPICCQHPVRDRIRPCIAGSPPAGRQRWTISQNHFLSELYSGKDAGGCLGEDGRHKKAMGNVQKWRI